MIAKGLDIFSPICNEDSSASPQHGLVTIQFRAGVQASRRVTEHDRPVKPNGIAANKCPEPNRMREWLRLLRNASDRIPRSVSARESPQAFARGCRRSWVQQRVAGAILPRAMNLPGGVVSVATGTNERCIGSADDPIEDGIVSAI